ncbi:hypothetical protein ACH5RR_013183 [Cinchona calisaya]|uniref:Uncharacterized protein n=1 Tax=Cinchona calisaya TaxID=153742 RepID=A0ABD2ZZC0_9GENT
MNNLLLYLFISTGHPSPIILKLIDLVLLPSCCNISKKISRISISMFQPLNSCFLLPIHFHPSIGPFKINMKSAKLNLPVIIFFLPDCLNVLFNLKNLFFGILVSSFFPLDESNSTYFDLTSNLEYLRSLLRLVPH